MMTTTRTHTHRERIFAEIDAERDRQDAKFGFGPKSILPGDDDWRKLAVLGAEVGEVNRAMLEHSFGADTIEHIEEELVQVAAVAVAWLEFARGKRTRFTVLGDAMLDAAQRNGEVPSAHLLRTTPGAESE